MNVKERNSAVKQALSNAFPEAKKISVTGGRGTAYGWCKAKIYVPKPKDCFCNSESFGRCSYCRNQWDIQRRHVNEAVKEIEFYHYTDDMGDEHREFLYDICYE